MKHATCTVGDCHEKHKARGYCAGHYMRWLQGKPVDGPLTRRGGNVCQVPGCTKSYRIVRGMCRAHYYRSRNGLPMEPAIRDYVPGRLCAHQECDRPYYGGGLCRFHYDRRRSGQDLDAPLRAGRLKDKKGYILIRVRGYGAGAYRGGYVMEHRLVMEQVLGRKLLPNENVHHINGVRDDNRPENLELWVTSQPSGQRIPDLVAWAHEILDRYERGEDGRAA